MVRSTLVAIHIASGLGGLAAGLATLAPPAPSGERRWVRQAYLASILTLFASLVGMIAVDWAGLDTAARLTFSALAGLAAVMIYRLVRARGETATREAGWHERYIDHVAFSYIALWEGFVILPALNLPLPQVSVPVVAIAVLLVGHTLTSRYKARVASGRAGAARG